MAFYTYKRVCHEIPDKYIDEAFEKTYGEEFDGDANYNGDYWIAVADWIDDLQKEVKKANRLREALELIKLEIDETGDIDPLRLLGGINELLED